MGCYGIGVTRILGAAIEQNFDDKGIIWPASIAPFEVVLCPMGYDRSELVKEETDRLYAALQAAGVDVIVDDRGLRPGAMFADWELIGVPHRVVIGERGLKEGNLEYQGRRDAAATPCRWRTWSASSRANWARDRLTAWPRGGRAALAAQSLAAAAGVGLRPLRTPATRRKKRWPIRCGWRCRAPSPTLGAAQGPDRRHRGSASALPGLAGRDVGAACKRRLPDEQMRTEFLETPGTKPRAPGSIPAWCWA